MACHRIIKQSPQRAGPIGSELAESLEVFAGVRVLLWIVDLQRCEIELVEIIPRFLFYGSCELFFLFGIISFGTRQPPCDDMKGGSVTITVGNLIERLSSKVELSTTQCRENEIKLIVRIFGAQAHDLFTP